jgi:hypothetical protein
MRLGITRCGTIEPMAQGLHGVEIPRGLIEGFCGRNHIRKLSFFGSILTDRFRTVKEDLPALAGLLEELLAAEA